MIIQHTEILINLLPDIQALYFKDNWEEVLEHCLLLIELFSLQMIYDK